MPAHLAYFCTFLVEMRSYHIAQAGLELLSSNNLPASAFQSAGITGMSHHAQLFLKIFTRDKVSLCYPDWSQIPELTPRRDASQSVGIIGVSYCTQASELLLPER